MATYYPRGSAPVYPADQEFVPLRKDGHAPTAEELLAAHPETGTDVCAKLPAGVPMPRVIVLRHGETAWSLSGQHTGRTNLKLTDHGEELMRHLGPFVVGPDPRPEENVSALLTPHHLRYMFVSPRGRSLRTLQLLLEHLPVNARDKLPPAEVRQECREWDYGLMEGKTPHECRAIPGYAKWDIWHEGTPDDPEDPASPGESVGAVTARIDSIIHQIRLLQRAAAHGYLKDLEEGKEGHRTADILIVAHGHFNRCFIARWLGLPLWLGQRFAVDAGAIAVLSYAHKCFDEPTLGSLFSAQDGMAQRPGEPSKDKMKLQKGNAPIGLPKPLIAGAMRTAGLRDAVLHCLNGRVIGPNPDVANPAERQYLALVQAVLDQGEKRADRTGTGTLAIFAPRPMKFDLSLGTLPLLTTKRVFFRGVAEELLWFVQGSTDAKILAERGVHIWDGNGSEEFLRKCGLPYREGDLGPVYGFQWRHYDAPYTSADADYTGMGVDQLSELINTIKTNPTDRRIILSAWNPAQNAKMALPPCHVLAQFFVSHPGGGDCPGELSCQMYQRSADLGLGVPFNIASYALLTHMIAHVTGLRARELTIVLGDAHVYLDHVEPLREQLKRDPFPFPTLAFSRKVDTIDGFTTKDFSVENYKVWPKIEMKMAV